MNKRRSDASSAAAMSAPSKKRKMDNVQKFYAVRAGFRPGVYENYADCQAQTAGFKGAIFKSFTSRQDAEDFAAGKQVASATDGPKKFYAVAVGNPTGIFTDWADASLSIKGIKGPKYKRFNTRPEAVDYIKTYGSKETIEALGETFEPPAVPEERPSKVAKLTKDTATKRAVEDGIKIWTDGSSRRNGTLQARAGIGVFFGHGDKRNVSERLAGEPQTNQRAELMAMLRAMQAVPLKEKIIIISDSQYSINCITVWADGWKKKEWKTAAGGVVKNQDIIKALVDKMEERQKAGGVTSFEWVKGHHGDHGNEAADKLAIEGADKEAV